MQTLYYKSLQGTEREDLDVELHHLHRSAKTQACTGDKISILETLNRVKRLSTLINGHHIGTG